MAAPHSYRTEAVVLRRIDLGEADKILTLYTPHKGKQRVVAKGVRRPTSKLGGHVELFIHNKLQIAKARNLDLVTQAETIEPFLGLRDDLLRITYANYVAELIDQLTEENIESEATWDLLLKTLRRLSEDSRPEIVVRFFEMQLLDFLGYRPQLQQCIRCERVLEPVANFYSALSGGVLCTECGRTDPSARGLSVNALKVLRLLQRGDYATAARLNLSPELAAELEALMRIQMQMLAEREIKSTHFLALIRNATPA